jgi:hypothetical protein
MRYPTLFRGASNRRRDSVPGRTPRLNRIVQGQHISAYGRQHQADHCPGAPVFVEPAPKFGGVGVFRPASFVPMGVTVWYHNHYPYQDDGMRTSFGQYTPSSVQKATGHPFESPPSGRASRHGEVR